MAFLLSGLAASAASAYVANKAYDVATSAYMYIAERIDAAKEAPARALEARRRAKMQAARERAAAYRKELRAKYHFDKNDR